MPGAASTMRAAFEAISVWKCSRLISRVSMSCACGSGAVTRRIGSSGEEDGALRHRVDVAGEAEVASQSIRRVENRPDGASHCQLLGVEPQPGEISTTCSSPAASRKPRGARQPAHEELEDRGLRHRPVEIDVDHREFVKVGQEWLFRHLEGSWRNMGAVRRFPPLLALSEGDGNADGAVKRRAVSASYPWMQRPPPPIPLAEPLDFCFAHHRHRII